jgi:hypothetical protein
MCHTRWTTSGQSLPDTVDTNHVKKRLVPENDPAAMTEEEVKEVTRVTEVKEAIEAIGVTAKCAGSPTPTTHG